MGNLYDINENGLTFQHLVSNFISGGSVYWMVMRSGANIPSPAEIRSGSSNLCIGTVAQGDDLSTSPISCSLEYGVDYDFWIFLDTNAAGTSGSYYLLNFTPGRAHSYFFWFFKK